MSRQDIITPQMQRMECLLPFMIERLHEHWQPHNSYEWGFKIAHDNEKLTE